MPKPYLLMITAARAAKNPPRRKAYSGEISHRYPAIRPDGIAAIPIIWKSPSEVPFIFCAERSDSYFTAAFLTISSFSG